MVLGLVSFNSSFDGFVDSSTYRRQPARLSQASYS
jgi:hypothetical protein